MSEISKLKKDNLLLMLKNEENNSFIEELIDKCLPIALEITAAKGWFKVFKIVKMALYLVKILIDMFDKKPEPIRWL